MWFDMLIVYRAKEGEGEAHYEACERRLCVNKMNKEEGLNKAKIEDKGIKERREELKAVKL